MSARDERPRWFIFAVQGNEKQSEEMVAYLLQEFEGDTGKIWQSNIFGKSFHQLVNEDLQGKPTMTILIQIIVAAPSETGKSQHFFRPEGALLFWLAMAESRRRRKDMITRFSRVIISGV